MRSSRVRPAVVIIVVALVLAACAAGPNPDVAHTAQSAGFWLGLWHGLITPITFVVSLFTDHVNIYEVQNNGNWYDFGYVLGLSAAFGGMARSGASASRARTSSAGRHH